MRINALYTTLLLSSLLAACGDESTTDANNSPLGSGGAGGDPTSGASSPAPGNPSSPATSSSPTSSPTGTVPPGTTPAPAPTPAPTPTAAPTPTPTNPTPGAGGAPSPSTIPTPAPTPTTPEPEGTGGTGGTGGDGPTGSGGNGGSADEPTDPDPEPGPSGATPSQGCSSGGGGSNPNANISNAIVSFPQGYDGSTPVPMLFGFHGAGRDNTQFRTVDARTQNHALEQNYVMVYLKSSGNDWTGDLNGNKSRFNSTYDSMVSQFCIDTSRVYAIGHSSGAQFITNLICGGEDRLRAIGPVASSRYCQNHGPIAVMYIQGQNDRERGGSNGKDVVDVHVAANGCGSSSPFDVSGCSSGGTQVNPGCVEYDGCSLDTYWCSHNDPNYSNTNHGWPCFANDALFAFFETQR